MVEHLSIDAKCTIALSDCSSGDPPESPGRRSPRSLQDTWGNPPKTTALGSCPAGRSLPHAGTGTGTRTISTSSSRATPPSRSGRWRTPTGNWNASTTTLSDADGSPTPPERPPGNAATSTPTPDKPWISSHTTCAHRWTPCAHKWTTFPHTPPEPPKSCTANSKAAATAHRCATSTTSRLPAAKTRPRCEPRYGLSTPQPSPAMSRCSSSEPTSIGARRRPSSQLRRTPTRPQILRPPPRPR